MFGLEKENRPFQFDLEVELKKDPKKLKEKLAVIEARIAEIKNALREGTQKTELEEYGILLHGYTALKKVLNNISAKS